MNFLQILEKEEEKTADLLAATAPENSAWVSANAGTGKTRLLVGRVLRLLLAGVAPERILCITYTNAAAAEMANRIHAELTVWAVADEEKLGAELSTLTGEPPSPETRARARVLFARVLDSPLGLRIETMHAFCRMLLQRFPLEAGLSPHFSVIDERSAAEMLREACQHLYAMPPGEDEQAAAALSSVAARLSELALRELLGDAIKQRRKLGGEGPLAERLTRRASVLLGIGPGVTLEALVDRHFTYTEDSRATLIASAKKMALGKRDDRQTAEALHAWFGGRQEISHAESYARGFLTSQNEPRKKLFNKGTLSPAEEQAAMEENARVLRFCEEWRSLRTLQATRHLLTLVDTLLARYAEQKARHGALDYDDLILAARDLLSGRNAAAWVLYKLDGGIDHVLIDEAQDTSPEQWQLMEQITNEFFAGAGAAPQRRTLFVVGDEKQSIYRFQGAEPRNFGIKQHGTLQRARAAGLPFYPTQLDLSYRSTEPVLQLVDAVFAAECAYAGLTARGAPTSHRAHRVWQAGLVELWPLMEADAREERLPWEPEYGEAYGQTPSQRLAAHIAGTIRGWLDQGEMLPSRARPMRAGDILILVRRRGGFVYQMVRALKRRGVAVAGIDRMALTGNLAVRDLLALGNFLLLPEDDLNLAALLKSPLYGLSEEQLFRLAWQREATLWASLQSKRGECEAFADARAELEALLAMADFRPPYELFAHVLETRGGRKRILARMGEEYGDPLDEFLLQALAYSRAHPPSLQGFLHWLECAPGEIKRDMDEGRDEVRVMTVHGAKGLEAPVVFLPDTVRPPQMNEKILWHGDGADAVPLWPAQKPKDTLTQRLWDKLRDEEDAEYRRLLYVAMTRAEDRLYICGWKGLNDNLAQSWYSLVKAAMPPLSEPFAMPWGEGRRLECAQRRPPDKVEATAPPRKTAAPPLPDVLRHPAPEEDAVRMFHPSRIGEEDEPPALRPSAHKDASRRGVLIHRLLQFLPGLPPDTRESGAGAFLRRHAPDMPERERGAMAAEVLAVLSDPGFQALFGPDSLAEVPILGRLGGPPEVIVSGQVDRLVIGKDKIMVVDYKTNRAPPEAVEATPAAYLRQMAAYREVLRVIRPECRVECLLLWTSGARLMPIPDALLDARLPLTRHVIAPK